MLGRFTILQKGLLLIIVPLALQAFFAGLLLWRLNLRNNVENWAIHTKEVIAQAETVFRILVESDSEVNTYALTGEQRMGKTFLQTLEALPKETASLEGLVNDNPLQVRRARAIGADAGEAAGLMRSLYEDAQVKDTAAVNAILQTISERNIFARVRRELNDFVREEENLDRGRLEALRTTQVQQAWILIGGMVFLLIVGTLCAVAFGRTIVRRLAVLNENVGRLARGESLASRVGGTDEIAALDDSFHRMAEELRAAARKEKAAQEDLARRAVELAAMNRELVQKSDENEMFVYSVSHDLRSPLVNLQGFSKELSLSMKEMRAVFGGGEMPAQLKAEGEDILDHGMAEPVTFIQTAVTRLSAIIDALLRLSRVGRVEYQRKEIALDSVIRRILDAASNTVNEKHARAWIEGELPRVWGDPTTVEQIFANLVANALNYLDKKRPGLVEIGGGADETDPSLAVCYVKDNGLGIPEAYSEKVFGIFQRVHGNVAVGEGVGLALVKKMVERHHGRIWLESREGVGTTFFVALPRAGAAPSRTPAAPEKTPAGLAATSA